MGKIGQQLPKVLWPVFEKSLLELQVAYARSLGIKNIFINLHYMGEQIEEYIKSKSVFENVTILWEKPEILDIGGAVHNLACLPSVNYKGHLLVLNADQFFYLTKEQITSYVDAFSKAPSILFTYWVNPSLGYNALQIDGSRMVKDIIKNKDLPSATQVETYTGISIIDLSQLKPVAGVSSFFQSVCLFKEQKIPAVLLEDVYYWDFGTAQRFWETSFRILETYATHSNHPFLRFLVQERALKTWKINLTKISYHARSARVINLGPEALEGERVSSIVIKDGPSQVADKKMIWWQEIGEEIN